VQVKSIRISNYRCIRDALINLEAATVFVGPNGSGKSTVLRALDAFYSGSPNIAPDDFYNRDTSRPIEIELTFHQFSAQERELFISKIDGDHLSVVRIFDQSSRNGRYFGTSLHFAGFREIRAVSAASYRL